MTMNATLLYRVAAVLFVIFAISHTFGVLGSKQPSPEVGAVRSAMDSVHWRFMGSEITYGRIYVGFGLLLTAALLFSAFLAWHLSGMAQTNPQAIALLAWVFFAYSIANLILSWIYFFAGPIAASAVISACLGWAAWRVTAPRTSAR
jgi:hypothetical protein